MLNYHSGEPEQEEPVIINFTELSQMMNGYSNMIDKMDVYAEKYGHMTVTEMIEELFRNNVEWFIFSITNY